MGKNVAWVSSNIYATDEQKPNFDICFCLQVTIFLESLNDSMPNRKCCSLEMKMLIEKLKPLICRWMIK